MRSLSFLVLVVLAMAPCLAHSAEQQPSKRALLAAETELTTETPVESGRKLLCQSGSCVRPLSKVQSHKTPTAPKISRKSFDRKMPKRSLLATLTELETTVVEGSRKLLCQSGSCVRPLSKVQSHKTPQAPKISRKSFDRKMPKRSLLTTLTELETTVVEGSRKLLCTSGSCVRPLSSVQSHKTPQAPKISRKSFDRKFPKRSLLASLTELETTVVEGSRKLLCTSGSCVRPLSSVQSHKTPQAPRMTRKSFDRKMP